MSTDNTISTPVLRHTDPDFVPLDSACLNDMRRRIVANEIVSDDELRHAIQSKLYDARQLLANERKTTAKTQAKKLDPSVNFDDLLA